jgi:hypothetical protein
MTRMHESIWQEPILQNLVTLHKMDQFEKHITTPNPSLHVWKDRVEWTHTRLSWSAWPLINYTKYFKALKNKHIFLHVWWRLPINIYLPLVIIILHLPNSVSFVPNRWRSTSGIIYLFVYFMHVFVEWNLDQFDYGADKHSGRRYNRFSHEPKWIYTWDLLVVPIFEPYLEWHYQPFGPRIWVFCTSLCILAQIENSIARKERKHNHLVRTNTNWREPNLPHEQWVFSFSFFSPIHDGSKLTNFIH